MYPLNEAGPRPISPSVAGPTNGCSLSNERPILTALRRLLQDTQPAAQAIILDPNFISLGAAASDILRGLTS